ncbi:MAG: universal stress protein [Puniceicoccales bacterium]|nr:universal stress protein [Puniceicoccales bacterium]
MESIYNETVRNILVCVDGSDYSTACCQHAIAIAKPRKAHVDVIYTSDMRVFEMSIVSDFIGDVNCRPYTGIMGQMQLAEKVKSGIIEKIVCSIFEKNNYLPFMNFHHLNGFLIDIVEEFESNDRGVDLIILGKRGEHFQKFKGYLGSTTERIIKSMGTPCLITTEKFCTPEEILVAYDGSDHSRAAVRGILRSCDIFGGKIHLVTVHGNDDGDNVAEEQLNEVYKLFKETTYHVCTALLTGPIDQAINKYIKVHKINLLVMGAFGRSGIRHLIAGSITTKLLTTTNVDTLVYRDDN